MSLMIRVWSKVYSGSTADLVASTRLFEGPNGSPKCASSRGKYEDLTGHRVQRSASSFASAVSADLFPRLAQAV